MGFLSPFRFGRLVFMSDGDDRSVHSIIADRLNIVTFHRTKVTEYSSSGSWIELFYWERSFRIISWSDCWHILRKYFRIVISAEVLTGCLVRWERDESLRIWSSCWVTRSRNGWGGTEQGTGWHSLGSFSLICVPSAIRIDQQQSHSWELPFFLS